MNCNDELWKGLIEDIFPSFIPFFLPAYAHLFDESQPVEFLDKELQQIAPEEEGRSELRFVDKLVKVHTVSGEEKWILIHIEVQGYPDTGFGRRMFRYFSRILDRYKMPVTAIAIFTDPNPSFCPDNYRYNFAGTSLFYRFNTYKVLQQDEERLRQSNNPFSIAILTVLLALKQKKLDDDNLLPLKTGLVRQLFLHHFEERVIRHLLYFIRVYVSFARPETKDKFEEEIEQLPEKRNNMTTRDIALQILQREAKTEENLEQKSFFVANLLRATDFTDEKIATLAGVTVEFVQETKHKIAGSKMGNDGD